MTSHSKSFLRVVVLLVMGVPSEGGAEDGAPPSLQVVARAIAEAVVASDAEGAALLCAVPTNLDGEVVTTRERLRESWQRVLSNEGLRGLRLQEIEILTREEAVERHGPPPQRLGIPSDEDLYVALIKWDRSQLVLFLALRDGRWAVVAVTD